MKATHADDENDAAVYVVVRVMNMTCTLQATKLALKKNT